MRRALAFTLIVATGVGACASFLAPATDGGVQIQLVKSERIPWSGSVTELVEKVKQDAAFLGAEWVSVADDRAKFTFVEAEESAVVVLRREGEQVAFRAAVDGMHGTNDAVSSLWVRIDRCRKALRSASAPIEPSSAGTGASGETEAPPEGSASPPESPPDPGEPQ